MFHIASALCVLETYFCLAKLSSPLIQTGIKLVYQAALLDFLNIVRSNGSNSSNESFYRGCDAQKDSTVSQFLFHHVRFLGQFTSRDVVITRFGDNFNLTSKASALPGAFPT